MASKSLGVLTLDLVAKIGGFTEPLDKASRESKKKMRQIENDAKSAAAGIAKITVAAAAAGAGLVAYAKVGMNAIDVQAKLARRLATTIGEMRGIELAAADAGIAQGALTSSLESYNKRLGDAARGTGEAQKAYKALGLEAAELAKMPLPEQLELVAKRISELDTAAERSSIADRLMSGGRRMINLFEDGGDSIKAAVEEVEGFGLAISAVDSAAVEKANDSIARLGLLSEAAQNAVAVELAPALGDMADSLMDVAKAFHDGEYEEQVELLGKVATVAAGAAAAYGTYRGAIAAATIAQWAFNAAVSANPISALVLAAGTAVGSIYAFREELGLTGDEAAVAAINFDDLTESVGDLTKAQQENKRVKMASDLADMRMEAKKLQAELDCVSKLVEQSGQLTPQGGALPVATAEDIARGRELRQELSQLNANIDAGSDLLKEYDGIMSSLGDSSEEAARKIRAATDGIGKMSSGLPYDSLLDSINADERGKQIIAAQQAEFEATRRSLDQRYAIEQEYQERVKALRAGAAEDADVNALMIEAERQKNEQLLELNGSYWDQYLVAAEESLTDFKELSANVIEGFSSRFGDAFESVIFDAETMGDAIDGLAEGMARSVVNSVGEMAAQWLALQAVQLAVGKTTAAAAAGEAAAAGAAISAAYGPAAIAASLATSGTNSVGAIAGITATTSAMQATNIIGMAHSGIDEIPQDGTWLLKKKERVLTSPQADKLDRVMETMPKGGSGNVEVNNVFQISAGVAGTVRAEFMKMMPMVEERSKRSVMEAISNGGPMAKATGRRR